ncbi:MAG TPA: hypothetical protein VGN72_08020 [Tepidisphaeraceae bacterium]|jgi:hypothetical protein|nr:hypothetical protein [Tepidisphaeraceae bacterium]
MRNEIAAMLCGVLVFTGCTHGEPPQPKAATMKGNKVHPAKATTMASAQQAEAGGWELVPSANYTATQTPGEMTITARGEAPTGGYEVKLQPSKLKIYPPQYLLQWKKPDGPAFQAIWPFEVNATFKADEPVAAVAVTDGAGKHEVKVDKALD